MPNRTSIELKRAGEKRSALRRLVAAIEDVLDEIAFADADSPWHSSCGIDPALNRQLDGLLSDLQRRVGLWDGQTGRQGRNRLPNQNTFEQNDGENPIGIRIAELRDLVGYGAGALTWSTELELRFRQVAVFLCEAQDGKAPPSEERTAPAVA
jgi:hypothetical protein